MIFDRILVSFADENYSLEAAHLPEALTRMESTKTKNENKKINNYNNYTFVGCCHCREENNKKCCGVFPRIGKVRKLLFGVTVSAQTLCKAPPRWKASEQRSKSVKFATTLTTIWERNNLESAQCI